MSLGHTASQAVSGIVTCLQRWVIYLVDIFIWSIYFLQLKTHCPAPRACCHQSQGGRRTRLPSLLGLLDPWGWKRFRWCHSLHWVVSCQFLWLTRMMLYSLLLGPIQMLSEIIIIPLTGASLRPVLMKTSWVGRNPAFSNIPSANCCHHPL